MNKLHRPPIRAFLCAAAAALLLCAALLSGCGAQESSSLPASSAPVSVSQSTAPSAPSSSEPEEKIPVDFDALKAQNADIYAWLSMPDAGIDYPILRREGSDEYYLRKDIEGNYSVAGSLFTESSYNEADFSDPVTLIYGHSMDDGSMFGQLEAWCQQHAFGEDTTFTIYQPGRRLTYRVFAAVPYDDSHVLYYHDFTDESVFRKFFEENVFSVRDLHAVLDADCKPEPDDHVVMLSTCLRGDSTRRYLVMGLLVSDESL